MERHGLWDDAQFAAAAEADKLIEDHKLEVVRLSFPDQHGILRGKTVVAGEAAAFMRNGCTITTTLLAKDTAHKTVFPVFTPSAPVAQRSSSVAAASACRKWKAAAIFS